MLVQINPVKTIKEIIKSKIYMTMTFKKVDAIKIIIMKYQENMTIVKISNKTLVPRSALQRRNGKENFKEKLTYRLNSKNYSTKKT